MWYRVIIVSALSLSLRDKEREREKREIELDNYLSVALFNRLGYDYIIHYDVTIILHICMPILASI